ncbi:conjugal transfer protein MobA [Petrimonas sulfuriphila]|uniref:conjugal transfer protein MobA n=1 Tax=Petrimonas sulfuriphila TaxID=285070 RepID=UPI003EBA228F
MEKEKSNMPKSFGKGRKPKSDPAVFRYSVSFNATDHARFLALFEQSGMRTKAHFITARIFGDSFKVIKIDKTAVDYYIRLTNFYAQFRAIGVNYNQIVKALNSNFTEKKALAFLYKLEKATLELVELNRKIIDLTKDFKQQWLQK